MDKLKLIASMIKTLDTIPVSGKDNMDRMLGVILALEKLQAMCEEDEVCQETTKEEDEVCQETTKEDAKDKN